MLAETTWADVGMVAVFFLGVGGVLWVLVRNGIEVQFREPKAPKAPTWKSTTTRLVPKGRPVEDTPDIGNVPAVRRDEEDDT